MKFKFLNVFFKKKNSLQISLSGEMIKSKAQPNNQYNKQINSQ